MNKDKIEELLGMSKLASLIKKEEDGEKKGNTVLWVLAIVGAIAAVAGIAYAVYRFLTPDYLEDFDDDSVNVTKENLKRFAGVFNGNGFSIRGLNIDSDKRYEGLFGFNAGIISNLTIKNSNIKGGTGVEFP